MLHIATFLCAFQPTHRGLAPARTVRTADVTMNWVKAKPIHKDPENPMKSVFTVEKATEEKIAELGVKSWPTWSTEGSAKYKTGEISPLKVYDTNELSYIISGKMEIIPEETGEPVLVEAGGARWPLASAPLELSTQKRVFECLDSQISSPSRTSFRVDGTCWRRLTSTGSAMMRWACQMSEDVARAGSSP